MLNTIFRAGYTIFLIVLIQTELHSLSLTLFCSLIYLNLEVETFLNDERQKLLNEVIEKVKNVYKCFNSK